MSLSRKQREDLYGRYRGHCAYCGKPLGQKWHADHVKPVERIGKWVRTGRTMKWQATGELGKPQNDHPDNFMPACIPCNIHKSDLPLESWRRILQDLQRSLRDNQASYRHALRFGLISEAEPKVVFHFERTRRSVD